MYQNIHLNNVKAIKARLYAEKYYDFMISKDETFHQSIDEIDSLNICEFSYDKGFKIAPDGTIYSTKVWADAITDDIELNDIGLTGVDNGFICFDKTTISKEDFIKLYTGSTYSITSGDTAFFMTPIGGNTARFTYPLYLHEDNNNIKENYLSFRGGFYQGFYKLYGFNYQTLPNKIDSDLFLHFELRPRTDYELSNSIINYLHPENKGIFFYIGLRGENKFWKFYKTDSGDTNDYIINSGITDADNGYPSYLAEETPLCNNSYFGENNDYFGDSKYLYIPECGENDKVIDRRYFASSETINEKELVSELTDSEGHNLNKKGYYSIDTDNKFLMFDRTPDGITTHNYQENMMIRLEGRKDWDNINLFPLLDRTPNGLTIHDLENYYEEHTNTYDMLNDAKNNGFALQIKEDGSIGYKYGVLDCDNENHHYSIVSEFSKPNIIKDNEWNTIDVRFAILNPSNNKCDNSPKRMKIMIYVNGFLKLVSKELNSFQFREIANEIYQKQEGVPYNISLGGGTLGLLEMITPNFFNISNYCLPIEKNFCGSFIGDIRSFKIYNGFINLFQEKAIK